MDTSVSSVTLVNSKTCKRCNGIFSSKDFPIDSSKKDGKSIYCSNCHRKINKARRSKPEYNSKRKRTDKERLQNREWRLKNKYGITISQFDTMFKTQGSICALCKSNKSDHQNFVVDHCHKTGKIRGILCSYCNRALGMLKDDPEILKQAIEYLEK